MSMRAIRPTKRFSIRDTRYSLPYPRTDRERTARDEGGRPQATPLEFLSTGPWGLVYRPPAVPPPHSPPRVVRTDQAVHPISYATYRFRSRCVLRAGHGHGHRPLPVLCCGAVFLVWLPPRAAPPIPTLPSRRPRHPLIAAALSSNPVRSGCRLVYCKTMTLDTASTQSGTLFSGVGSGILWKSQKYEVERVAAVDVEAGAMRRQGVGGRRRG
ncbi:hypothetical protein B0H14DRAFT_2915624 [Mycena olivaceomarginata]|nr:hypothetical protein B0H14DRAFT_2915624 [Mycena olivaceomarginata]